VKLAELEALARAAISDEADFWEHGRQPKKDDPGVKLVLEMFPERVLALCAAVAALKNLMSQIEESYGSRPSQGWAALDRLRAAGVEP